MTLHAGGHGIIIGADLAAKRMLVPDITPNRALPIAGGIHLVEACVTLADNRLPDQQLCSDCMAERSCIRGVLRTPGCGYIALIAILHDPAKQDLDGIRGNGRIEVAGVVFPKCLILVGEGIAGILPDAGLDAIRNLTVIGADAMHRCVFAVEKPPSAHQRRGRVAPRRRRVVAVAVAWEIHHVSVYRRCGKHRCADRQKRHHAHEQGQECRKGFLERFTFHRSFTSCFLQQRSAPFPMRFSLRDVVWLRCSRYTDRITLLFSAAPKRRNI